MRKATTDDLAGIAELLGPLEQKGILKPRTREQLKAELPHYTVIDLEVWIRAHLTKTQAVCCQGCSYLRILKPSQGCSDTENLSDAVSWPVQG